MDETQAEIENQKKELESLGKELEERRAKSQQLRGRERNLLGELKEKEVQLSLTIRYLGALERRRRIVSSDLGRGRVGVVVYPWEVALARELPEDSTLNHVRAPIASLVPVGNRLRVRVGPLTAEITAASGARLELREGEPAVASFKATGTRLVPLG